MCCSTLAGVGRGGGHDEAILGRAARWCRRRARSRPRAASGRSAPGRRRASRRCWCRARSRKLAGIRRPARRSCRASRHRRRRRRARTARTSRLTLSSQSVSPGRGYHCARSQAPVSTNTAPCSCAQRCDGGRRVGRKSLPRCVAGERADRRPARRAGGTSSCRSAGSSRPVSSAMMREAGDVGGLALVGRHAERGVALQVLDRAEALALRRARRRRR